MILIFSWKPSFSNACMEGRIDTYSIIFLSFLLHLQKVLQCTYPPNVAYRIRTYECFRYLNTKLFSHRSIELIAWQWVTGIFNVQLCFIFMTYLSSLHYKSEKYTFRVNWTVFCITFTVRFSLFSSNTSAPAHDCSCCICATTWCHWCIRLNCWLDSIAVLSSGGWCSWVRRHLHWKVSKNAPRRPPLFPIDVRNMFNRTDEELLRANNSIESWHRGFQSKRSGSV